MFFVYGQDMAPGMVGPFATQEAADAHLEFWRQRGDAAVCVHGNARVVSEQAIQEDQELLWAYENNLCAPNVDREFVGDPLSEPHPEQ